MTIIYKIKASIPAFSIIEILSLLIHFVSQYAILLGIYHELNSIINESCSAFKMIFSKTQHMNAISQVAWFKSCISLNKRLWAKSFFRFLDRNFCRNDLKIFLHVKQRTRQKRNFFYVNISKTFSVDDFENQHF